MNFQKGYLQKNNTNRLRGILALGILLHHISLRCWAYFPFNIFIRVGCLIVAVFFFLSGYGMYSSYQNNFNIFKLGFRKRLWRLLIPFLTFLLLYCILLIYNVGFQGLIIRLKDGRAGDTLGNWFVYELLIIYCLFFCVFCTLKIKENFKLLLFCLILLLFCSFLKLIGFGAWWYNAVMSFPLGILCALKKEKIIGILDSLWKNVFLILVCSLGYLFFRYLGNHVDNTCIIFISALLQAPFFSLAVVCCTYRIQFTGSVLKFFGDISYELFLCQGMIIYLFGWNMYSPKSDFVYMFAVGFSSLFIAVIFHFVFNKLLKKD